MSAFSSRFVSRENALLAWVLLGGRGPSDQDLEDFLNRYFRNALLEFKVSEYHSSVEDNQELRDRCGL